MLTTQQLFSLQNSQDKVNLIKKFLIENNKINLKTILDNNGCNLLHYAIFWKSLPLVKYCIEEAEISPFSMDIDEDGNPNDLLKYINNIKSHEKDNSSHYELQEIETFIQSKRNNLKKTQNKKFIRKMLTSINENNLDLFIKDKENICPSLLFKINDIYYHMSNLIYASQIGNFPLVKLLLELGYDINSQSNFLQTSLHKAVMKGYIKITKFLLENGANPYIKDYFNHTPLHKACAYGNYDIAKLLIKYMQQIYHLNITDINGKTAFKYCIEGANKIQEENKINIKNRDQHAKIANLLLTIESMDPNIIDINYESPLLCAARESIKSNNYTSFKELLARPNINLLVYLKNTDNNKKYNGTVTVLTILQYAVIKKNLSLVKAICETIDIKNLINFSYIVNQAESSIIQISPNINTNIIHNIPISNQKLSAPIELAKKTGTQDIYDYFCKIIFDNPLIGILKDSINNNDFSKLTRALNSKQINPIIYIKADHKNVKQSNKYYVITILQYAVSIGNYNLIKAICNTTKGIELINYIHKPTKEEFNLLPIINKEIPAPIDIAENNGWYHISNYLKKLQCHINQNAVGL